MGDYEEYLDISDFYAWRQTLDFARNIQHALIGMLL